MTDEELVGWFFDTSRRINSQFAHFDSETLALTRGVYIHTVLQKPDVLAAIRARWDEAKALSASLDAS